MTELSHGRDRQGVVESFDVDRGLGAIRGADGTEHHFHCVEITDGSREIEVGAEVDFDVLAKLGRHEAANIRPRR